MMGGEIWLLVWINLAYEDGAREFLNLRREVLRLGFGAELAR